jgi:hypothetical protein
MALPEFLKAIVLETVNPFFSWDVERSYFHAMFCKAAAAGAGFHQQHDYLTYCTMKKMIFVVMVAVLATTGLFAHPDSSGYPDALSSEAPLLCTIKIQGSYNNVPIDINVTVQADNCAKAAGELLRAAMDRIR